MTLKQIDKDLKLQNSNFDSDAVKTNIDILIIEYLDYTDIFLYILH